MSSYSQTIQLLHTTAKPSDLAPKIKIEVFEIKEPRYNLRSEASHFKRENVKSTYYGI